MVCKLEWEGLGEPSRPPAWMRYTNNDNSNDDNSNSNRTSNSNSNSNSNYQTINE